VNRSYLARVEAGRPYVGLKVIGKLVEALEVEPSELLKLRPDEPVSFTIASVMN